WLDHARPSRARPHRGSGDHDRPAWPRTRQRRGYGDRGAPPRRDFRCRRRRSRHLRSGVRRRPHGGGEPGSDRARRPSAADQADGAVRRQRDFRRRRHRARGIGRSNRLVRRAGRRSDGHDPAAIAHAIETAQHSDRPSLIACRTTIGFGAPTKGGTEKSHGSPLGAEEIVAARQRLGWTAPAFEIPADIRAQWRAAGERNRPARLAWEQRLRTSDPGRRAEFLRRLRGEVTERLAPAVTNVKQTLAQVPKDIATRAASELVLDALTAALPEMIGGSADLTGSNNTRAKGMKVLKAPDYSGTFIHYGVREHGMAAAMNGMALHGGVIPYSGTFLVFSDYCRPAIRLAALIGQRVIFVMTHDSIGLGEDGPTHQPIEHLAALRAIPKLK